MTNTTTSGAADLPAMVSKALRFEVFYHPVESIFNIDHRLCDGTIVHL